MVAYETYHNNQLGVVQDVFVELAIASNDLIRQWITRGKLRKLRTGGNGRKPLIEAASIEPSIWKKIKAAYGDPYAKEDVDKLITRLTADADAATYFMRQQLSPSKEAQHYAEAIILNTYGELLREARDKSRRISSFKLTDAKKDYAHIISELANRKNEGGAQIYPHKLPKNWRSLERKYRDYNKEGYESLVHGAAGNKSAAKITGEVADYLLATYCQPNKPNTTVVHRMYCDRADVMKWPSLSESAIYAWLEKPEQKKLWTLARHGRDEYVKQYGHKIKRDREHILPGHYFGIDGTKLDWIHYKEGAPYGMGADIKIDVVFDIASERIMGYTYSTEHESHQHHFNAFKMAMQESGHKPYLITYDNQAGHKTAPMQELYSKLVTKDGGTHYPHRAHEHGSPVEQLFARFQKQVLNQWWWSDKQAVTVRTADSRPNMEFIKKHRTKLKTIEELLEAFQLSVDKWNNARHPLHKEHTRDAIYRTQFCNELEEITMLDMMNIFWVTTPKPTTYRREGLMITLSRKQYEYEVYDADGHVDLDFRDKYTGCKFFTQYDPDQLDNYVRLYLALPDGSMKYIADAQPVKKIKTIPALMTPEDKSRMHKMVQTRDQELQRVEQQLEQLRNRTNITPETLIADQELTLKMKGRVPKEQRTYAEELDFIDKL